MQLLVSTQHEDVLSVLIALYEICSAKAQSWAWEYSNRNLSSPLFFACLRFMVFELIQTMRIMQHLYPMLWLLSVLNIAGTAATLGVPQTLDRRTLKPYPTSTLPVSLSSLWYPSPRKTQKHALIIATSRVSILMLTTGQSPGQIHPD